MLHISLFSGIGGFDLAAEWMGWTNIVSCEINDFGNKVLEHYWPNAYHHRDIKTLTLETINEQLGHNWRTDDVILTGGFPCQPYSSAGKRKGKEDERHLWPEMLRVIREIKPSYIVGENVAGLLSWSGGLVFDEVHSDLEVSGYEVQSFILPAAAVNAPHRRDRVWFVAFKNPLRNGCAFGELNQEGTKIRELWNACAGNSNGVCEQSNARTTANTDSIRQYESLGEHEIDANERGKYAQRDVDESNDNGDATNTLRNGLSSRKGYNNGKVSKAYSFETFSGSGNWDNFPTVPTVCSRNDGLSNQLDGITFPKWRKESIKAAGNAVVPQVVYEIFKAIDATRK